jgi:hypothetical protein
MDRSDCIMCMYWERVNETFILIPGHSNGAISLIVCSDLLVVHYPKLLS